MYAPSPEATLMAPPQFSTALRPVPGSPQPTCKVSAVYLENCEMHAEFTFSGWLTFCSWAPGYYKIVNPTTAYPRPAWEVWASTQTILCIEI